MQIREFCAKHLSFATPFVTILAIIVAILVYPCTAFLPVQFGYENGLLENIQIIILWVAFVLAVISSKNKKFFYFAAMVIGILFLREINCGRTIFFPIPGEPNKFYGWKEITYGYLAHPIFGLYIAYTAFYFIKNKLYLPLIKYIKDTKLPVWNILLLLGGMAIGLYAEKRLSNFVLEEMGELLFYVSLMGIIFIYSRNKDYDV